MTIYVRRKNGNFWVKFELRSLDIIVSSEDYLKRLWVCAVTYSIKKVFRRRRVTGENMKTSENNLMKILNKKKFWFFLWFLSSEISKKCHFISPQNGFLPTLRWCKIFFEKYYEDKQKFLWKLTHRAFKRTNSHVHTTSRKKVPGIFRKNRSLVYPLE